MKINAVNFLLQISQIFAELIFLVIFVQQLCVFVVQNNRKELREFAKGAKRFSNKKATSKDGFLIF